MLSGHLGQSGAGSPARMGALVALFGAGSAAAAMIQTRRLTKSEATGAIVFYFSCVTGVIGLLILAVAALWPEGGAYAAIAAGQRFVVPSRLEFAALASIGLLGGCGQILMTHCYRFADASILAPFDYVSIIWATVLGYLLFSEIPTSSVLIGGGIVMAAGVAVIWRERAIAAPRLAARTSVLRR